MPSFSGAGAVSGAAAGTQILPGWGTLIGAAVGGFFGGSKVKAPGAVTVPPFKPVDLAAEQQRAIKGNLAAETDIEELLSRANTFGQGQASSLMEQAIPGWAKLSQKFLQTADQNLTNPYDVPKDVEQNLARIASERGISSGARGQFSQFSLLRDLGVNALQYGQQRINSAQNILSLVGSLSPRVSPLSPLSFYVNPAQAGTVAQGNAAGAAGVAGQNQGVQQGAANAATAAANLNSANSWNAISAFLLNGGLNSFIPAKREGVGPGGDPGASGIPLVPGLTG